MKPNVAWLLAGVLVVGRQPGMEPGMYVCSAGPRIREVKKHDIRVVDAPPAR